MGRGEVFRVGTTTALTFLLAAAATKREPVALPTPAPA